MAGSTMDKKVGQYACCRDKCLIMHVVGVLDKPLGGVLCMQLCACFAFYRLLEGISVVMICKSLLIV